MPRVAFTANLNRHLECPDGSYPGGELGEVLQAVFQDHPALRGYLLDDQGAIRKHVAVFIDNHPVLDRNRLTDAVPANGEIFVMQALSGG